MKFICNINSCTRQVKNGDTKTNIINNLMAILVSNLENYEFEARKYVGEITDENRFVNN